MNYKSSITIYICVVITVSSCVSRYSCIVFFLSKFQKCNFIKCTSCFDFLWNLPNIILQIIQTKNTKYQIKLILLLLKIFNPYNLLMCSFCFKYFSQNLWIKKYAYSITFYLFESNAVTNYNCSNYILMKYSIINLNYSHK